MSEYLSVWTESDEWYPYYWITSPTSKYREDEVLLTQEEVDFIKNADKNFRVAQELIEEGIKRAEAR